jgi:hypothetical protein
MGDAGRLHGCVVGALGSDGQRGSPRRWRRRRTAWGRGAGGTGGLVDGPRHGLYFCWLICVSR